jgi:uncharacterized protein (DUF433 family)
MNSQTSIIVKDSDILDGEPVFRGTNVPFKTLTEYLEEGKSLSQFLADYPMVSREAAITALEQAKNLVLAQFKKF